MSHRRITIAELQADHARATELASLPGGVDVVSDDGVLRFHLSIPSEPIDDEADVATAQRDRAVRVLGRLVRQLERRGGYSTPEEQADLREARAVLAEER